MGRRLSRLTLEILEVLLREPDKPRYGAEIMREIDALSGSTYPALAQLEQRGWLTSHMEGIDPHVEGRPPRRYYKLTPEGTVGAREAGASNSMLAHYSRALDEIYALRAIIAGEALRVQADLDLKSFPRSRRRFAEDAVKRLIDAARGATGDAYSTLNKPKAILRAVGAEDTLTRQIWEASASPYDVYEESPTHEH